MSILLRRSGLIAAGLVAVLGCENDRILKPADTAPDHPGLDAVAVRVMVDVANGEVRVLPASASSRDSGGPSLAILGTNEVAVTASNLVRSAPVNNKVTVTFDAAITNRLTSATLVPSTFPGTTGGAGLQLFPFRITQATGGAASQVTASADWNGDGSAGSGAPHNFFNDFGCPSSGTTADCFRWEQYPAPLGPGETTASQRVGFTLPKAITSFTVLLIVAADIRSDLPGVARLSVTPPSYVMNDGFAANFSAVAYDVANNPLTWATIKWTSPDATALEFQNGSALVGTITGPSVVVHGRKVGQISFTVSSGGISVQVPVDIQVNTIVLVQPYILPDSDLVVGEQVQAVAAVKDNSGNIVPGFNPTWSTSDPNVATVDPATGLISAVGPGTANITATAAAASGVIPITVSSAGLGALGGTVRDADFFFGTPVGGARIDVVQGGLVFSTTTDPSGQYSFNSIPAGQYQLTVQKPNTSCVSYTVPFLVTAGQSTNGDLYLDCPAVANGRVVEVFGNPLPGGMAVHFSGPNNTDVTAPVQSNGSYTAKLPSNFCVLTCPEISLSLYFMPASCALVSAPYLFSPVTQQRTYPLGDFQLDCRGRGTVVADLTISGSPPLAPVALVLTGPSGPYSQVQAIPGPSTGQFSFQATPPGDYVVSLGVLPQNCFPAGPPAQAVTLAVNATEHVPMAVTCH